VKKTHFSCLPMKHDIETCELGPGGASQCDISREPPPS
jgi:hypothetical protein